VVRAGAEEARTVTVEVLRGARAHQPDQVWLCQRGRQFDGRVAVGLGQVGEQLVSRGHAERFEDARAVLVGVRDVRVRRHH
jgi:hypothetical protein